MTPHLKVGNKASNMVLPSLRWRSPIILNDGVAQWPFEKLAAKQACHATAELMHD